MTNFTPDFAALGKTDWTKPQLDTKNKQWMIMAIATVVMLITIFLPWFYSAGWMQELYEGKTLYEADVTASGSGFSFWYGIMAFIFTLVALASIVYKQYKFFFWATALSAIMGIIAICTQSAAVEATRVISNSVVSDLPNGTLTEKLTKEEYEQLNKIMNGVLVNLAWGAMIHVAAALTGLFVSRKLILKGE